MIVQATCASQKIEDVKLLLEVEPGVCACADPETWKAAQPRAVEGLAPGKTLTYGGTQGPDTSADHWIVHIWHVDYERKPFTPSTYVEPAHIKDQRDAAFRDFDPDSVPKPVIVPFEASAVRKPEFPHSHEFNTVIHSNLEPVPADAPEQPASVKSLVKLLEANGWSVKVSYARAWRKGRNTGTYRRMESFGIYAYGSANPIVAIYWRFMDKVELYAWFRDTMALELAEKASSEAGKWTWQDGRILRDSKRHRVKVTDIKEFARVRGSVLPGWFAGIARRFAEQAAKALCGDTEEHEGHEWETTTGIMKICSGKATKPKETEGV